MNAPEHSDRDADADIEQLMAFAGTREVPPAAMTQRVRSAVMDSFEELPQPKRRTSRGLITFGTALAATVALVYLLQSPAVSVLPAGEVQFSEGTYSIQAADTQTSDASLVLPGATVQTHANSRLLLRLNDQTTLRSDAQTRFTVVSSNTIHLHQGRIYLDSTDTQPLQIVTRYGTVADIGTQFEVTSLDQQLTVAVREGIIDLAIGKQKLRSKAELGQGELLRFSGNNLTERSPITATDDHWQWIHQARPGFMLADRSVAEYLRWAARESGRPLRYQSDLVRQQAEMPKVLQGNAAVEADLASIRQVLRTTRFDLVLDPEDQLLIRFRAM